jgi:hypothetical protein
MTAFTITLACVAAIAAVVAVLALLALRHSRREAAGEAARVRERLEALESRLDAPATEPVVRPAHEYVITRLGELEPTPPPSAVPVRVTAPGFADAVLRETVVQTAALVHGVRRALAPEARNRIRFEMRRELKRSRKARKDEVREALRQYRARHRAEDPHGAAGREGAA